MNYIIILSNDSRSASHITNCAKSLSQENEVETFYKLDEFEVFLKSEARRSSDKEEIARLSISEKQKQSLFRQASIRIEGINLIIIDREILGAEDPVKFIQTLKERLAKSPFHKPEVHTRFMILSFDASTSAIDNLANSVVDDLVMKPIDDQLFMQKLSMILSDKRISVSQFLYNQAVESPVHMAKGTMIEELSELGFAIRSKQGAKLGRVVRVFSKMFGEKSESTLLAIIFNVEEHSKIPDENLIYYTFFGITIKQLLNVRKALHLKHGKPPHKPALSVDEMKIFERNRKNVAVIAFDAGLRAELLPVLQSNFINLNVHEYPSLITFGKKSGVRPQFDGAGSKDSLSQDPGSNLPVAFNSDKFIFHVNYANDIVSIQTKKVNLFDATDFQLISQQKKWMRYIDAEDLDETIEFLTYVKTHDKGHIFIRLRGPYSSIHLMYLEAVKVKGSTPPKIKIELTELKGDEGLEKWQSVRPKIDTKQPKLELDAIIIDTSSVTDEIQEWADRLHAFLESTQISTKNKKIPIIALVPESALAKLETFKHAGFSDVILNPFDRKLLIDKLSLHITGLCNEYGLTYPKFKEYTANIYIAETVVMEMASEFGLQIRYSKPLREGLFLRFFSPLFQDENFEGILGRSYAAVASAKSAEEFHNIFSFYGISDTFMKHIRKWIRDTHIARKDV